MDPAPRAFSELPRDPALGVPVPFACGTVEFGRSPDDNELSARTLDGRRVTQCALSRICGVCGAGLGRPIAFVGSSVERDRNAFHFPPAHVACAQALLDACAGVDQPVLGQDSVPASWVLLTTSGFEYVRPAREDRDRRQTFQPNSILGESTLSVDRSG